MSVLKRMLLIVIVIILILGLLWVGTCVYANFFRATPGELPTLPNIGKAAYTVIIENTGNLLLTNKYEQMGHSTGGRIFVLHGFWELTGQGFEYRASDLLLDEGIFGIITIKRR